MATPAFAACASHSEGGSARMRRLSSSMIGSSMTHGNSYLGFDNPQVSFSAWQDDPAMNTRELLARNLVKLMDHHGHTIKTLNAKMPDLSTGTIQRARVGSTNVELRHFDTIAAAFGLKPWQLLVMDFDPAAPPSLSQFSPLAQDLAQMLDRIPDEARKRKAYAMVVQLVEFANGPAAPAAPPIPAPDATEPSALPIRRRRRVQ
jgi:hypothetical protein